MLQAWQAQIQAGMERVAAEALDDLRASIHVDTGEMRDKAFAMVEVRGTKRTLVAGSAANHAVYEELGTSRRPGHPQIRQVVDRQAKRVTEAIRSARGGR